MAEEEKWPFTLPIFSQSINILLNRRAWNKLEWFTVIHANYNASAGLGLHREYSQSPVRLVELNQENVITTAFN